MPAKKVSPWIKFCLELFCTGKYKTYTDAMVAASPLWAKLKKTGKPVKFGAVGKKMQKKVPGCKKVAKPSTFKRVVKNKKKTVVRKVRKVRRAAAAA